MKDSLYIFAPSLGAQDGGAIWAFGSIGERSLAYRTFLSMGLRKRLFSMLIKCSRLPETTISRTQMDLLSDLASWLIDCPYSGTHGRRV